MKVNRIICSMAVICFCAYASQLVAQPPKDRPSDAKQVPKIPDGFKMQQLELGGQIPSEYAEKYLKELKKTSKVVKTYETKTKNGLVQSSVIVDQKHTITGSEKEYRIRCILVADDENELLFVITLGTLVPKWKTYEPTFQTMTKDLKLIDLSKDAKGTI